MTLFDVEYEEKESSQSSSCPKIVILDTETTGIDEDDRVIQLGFMVLDGDGVEVHNELFSSSVAISLRAMETHNITPEMLEGKPKCTQSKAFARLNELNSASNYLVIHNAPFDTSMLRKEGFEPKMRVIDTLRVTKHLLKNEEAHRLQYLRYSLGLYKNEANEAKNLGVEIKAHDAIGDVLILKLLLEELQKHKSLDEMSTLTQTPLIVEKFRFGKYKDRLIKDIAIEDNGYLKWLLKNMSDMDEDLRYSLDLVLKK